MQNAHQNDLLVGMTFGQKAIRQMSFGLIVVAPNLPVHIFSRKVFLSMFQMFFLIIASLTN
jgi:hypothetical protein